MTFEIHSDRWAQIRTAAEHASELGEPATLVVACDLYNAERYDSEGMERFEDFEHWLRSNPAVRSGFTPDAQDGRVQMNRPAHRGALLAAAVRDRR